MRAFRSFLIALLILLSFLSCANESAVFTEVPEGQDVVLAAGDLVDNVPRFYRQKVGADEIEFFVVKIGGVPGAYLNRCRKCFASGRGFSFDAPLLRCRTCNETFPVESVSTGIGSCFPIHIKGTSEEGLLRIRPSDLSSAYYQRF